LLRRYYKKLRDEVLNYAFEGDADLITTAENAFSRFFERPLKFGAMRIDAAGEEWRFVRPWPRMIADYIDSIMSPIAFRQSIGNQSIENVEASERECIQTMNLAILLSNRDAFIDYHNFLLARRIFKAKNDDIERRRLDFELHHVKHLQDGTHPYP
jgi:hypothetical protein